MSDTVQMLAGLLLLGAAVAGCSESTDLVVSAPGVVEDQPYATLRAARHPWLIATPVRVALGRPGQTWLAFADAESVSMTALKTGYAYTPVGMMSNLLYGKSVVGTDTAYRVPPGPVSLVVFNYYRRAVRGEPDEPPDEDELAEGGCWGTILTFTVRAGADYRLTPTMVDAPTSQFGKVPACMTVLDSRGGRVPAAARVFQPAALAAAAPAPSHGAKFGDGGPLGWIPMRQAIAADLPAYGDALARFNRAIAGDPPPVPMPQP